MEAEEVPPGEEKVFNLAPVPGAEKEMFGDVDPDSDSDHDLARNNLIALLEQGARSFQDLSDIAKSSQNPRAYEVLSTLLGTLVESNRALIHLKEKRNQMRVQGPTVGDVTNKQQNIFMAGTTHELQEMIRSLRDKN